MPEAASGLRVIGLDSGTRHFGWGICERVGTKFVHIAHGTISPGEHLPLANRLVVIEQELAVAIAAHKPDVASLESLFFAKDAQAMVKLGHARGVGMLVCARAGLPVFEYAPTRIKQAVTGSGRADKAQVGQMMRVVLGLASAPQADAADALAAAVTHLHVARFAAHVAALVPPKRAPRRSRTTPTSVQNCAAIPVATASAVPTRKRSNLPKFPAK